MAFTPGDKSTATNNTTAVTVMGAPAASTQRELKSLTIFNKDTVAATVIVRKNDNAVFFIIARKTLAVNETLEVSNVVCDSVLKSIEVVLAANVTTNQLDCVANYADLS